MTWKKRGFGSFSFLENCGRKLLRVIAFDGYVSFFSDPKKDGLSFCNG